MKKKLFRKNRRLFLKGITIILMICAVGVIIYGERFFQESIKEDVKKAIDEEVMAQSRMVEEENRKEEILPKEVIKQEIEAVIKKERIRKPIKEKKAAMLLEAKPVKEERVEQVNDPFLRELDREEKAFVRMVMEEEAEKKSVE